MSYQMIRNGRPSRWGGVVFLGAVLAIGGCKMDEVQIPGLDGPSELGLSVNVRAVPDVLTADGYSTAWIEAVLRDENGQRLAGREILFATADESGNYADIGSLHDPSSGTWVRAASATATSDGDGVARVIYKAPARPDLTANTTVMVTARPVSDDANAARNRYVRIELKSAEPRLFPGGSVAPTCNFVVQAPGNRAECTDATTCRVLSGTDILFQSTASGADGQYIVRYQWFWGDGSPMDDKPDTSHVYRCASSNCVYMATHIVTDDDGASANCSATFTVVSSLN